MWKPAGWVFSIAVAIAALSIYWITLRPAPVAGGARPFRLPPPRTVIPEPSPMEAPPVLKLTPTPALPQLPKQ